MAKSSKKKEESEKFKWRPGQREVVEAVARELALGNVVCLSMPTGSGKTLVALASFVRSGLERCIVVVRTRSQLQSFARDLNKFAADYTYTAIFNKSVVCDKGGACSKCDRDVDPDLLAEKLREDNDPYKAAAKLLSMNVCPYKSAWRLARYSDVILCTYVYAFAPTFTRILLRKLKRYGFNPYRTLLVIDEAHNIDRICDWFKAYASVDVISRALNALRELGFDYEAKLVEDLRCWVDSVLHDYSYGTELDEEPPVPSDTASLLAKLALKYKLKSVARLARFCYLALNLSEYSTLIRASNGVIAAIVDPSVPAQLILGYGAALLMSGTMPSEEYVAAAWGIPGFKLRYIKGEDLGVEGPPKPAVYIIADVTSRYCERNDEMYNKMASAITMIKVIAKGVVLAVAPSYDFLSELAKRLKMSDVFVEQRGVNVTSIPKNAKLILAVAGGRLVEGVELTEGGRSLISDVVIAGIPYPDIISDPLARAQARAVLERSQMKLPDYLREKAWMLVRQAIGRAARSPEDTGKTAWILDYRAARDSWWMKKLASDISKPRVMNLEELKNMALYQPDERIDEVSDAEQ